MTTDPRRLTDAAPLSAAELDQILRDNIHTRNGIAWIKNENLDGVVASYRLLAEQLAEAERERDAAGRLAQTQNKRYLEELEAERADHAATVADLERQLAEHHLPTEERRKIVDWGN